MTTPSHPWICLCHSIGCGLLVSLLSASLLGTAGAEPSASSTLVYYTVLHANLESVRETVAELLGTEGQVLVDRVGGRLIVNTTASRHVLVEQLLKGLDVALMNVRIEVRLKLRELTTERGGSIGGSGRSSSSRRDGSAEFKIKPRVHDDRTQENEDIQQILLVESGSEGSLRVGESIPYLGWLQEYGVNRRLFPSEIVWQEVGAFLTVQPQVIGTGPLIRLRITPELRGLVDHNPLRVKYSTVTTEVTVQDGETVDLGGLNKNRDFYGRFLVGMDRDNNERSLEITLTSHLASGH
jgi:hypothetical protein